MSEIKKCTKCHFFKPLSAFTRHSWLSGDKRVKTCTDCYHRYRRHIPYLLARDGFLCRECETPLPVEDVTNPRKVQVDHIRPQRAGGSDEATNLQLVHIGCNMRKRDKDRTAYLPQINL